MKKRTYSHLIKFSILMSAMFSLGISTSWGILSVPFSENFDDAITELTTSASPFGGAASAEITGGQAVLALDGNGSGNPRVALGGTVPGGLNGDFSIAARSSSTDTGQLDIDFSNSAWGIFAGASNLETDGIFLRIRTRFSSNDYTLELLNGDTILDSDSLGNLTGTFDTHDGFLSLSGTFNNEDGSLALTGTFTDNIPDSGGNNSGSVSATINSASIPDGDFFGLRALNLGGSNPSRVEFDDLSITAVPEPSSVATLVATGLLFALYRRRQHV